MGNNGTVAELKQDMLTICATITPIQHVRQVAQIPETAQLAEAHPLVPAAQSAHSCSATAFCQWAGKGNSGTCGAHITCESVPAHFRGTHGIRKLKADTLIECWWGCHKRVKRKFFVRHIRECHLGHHREKRHPSLKRR